MNIYLLSFIGLLSLLVVGFLFYGFLFKDTLKVVTATHAPLQILSAVGAMYATSVAFVYLYQHVTFSHGVERGLLLGLLLGIAVLAFPLFADHSYFRGDAYNVRVVVLNWVVSFVALGLVIGLFS